MPELFANDIVGKVLLRDRSQSAPPVECTVLRTYVEHAGIAPEGTEEVYQWISIEFPTGKLEYLVFDRPITVHDVPRTNEYGHLFDEGQVLHIALIPEAYRLMFETMAGNRTQGGIMGVQITENQWEMPSSTGIKAEELILGSRS
jgi:hypothetical protein